MAPPRRRRSESVDDKDPILFEVDARSGVATLTLNRPERFNAFNRPMLLRWRECLDRVERDGAIRALVVTGAGRAFCAGGEMDELESFLDASSEDRKGFLWDCVHPIALTLERIDRPVIAALNGTARGAGLDMALMCDIRIADRGVLLAESYIAMGLMPGDGGSWFLPRLVGVPKALELLWTGDAITGEEAERIGLVNRAVAVGQALAEARELAARIARQPAAAIRFTKRAVQQGMRMELRAHLDMVSSHMAVLEDMPDFADRVRAFKARRQAPRGG